MPVIFLIGILAVFVSSSSAVAVESCGTQERKALAQVRINSVAAQTEDGQLNIWSKADRHQLTYCVSSHFRGLREKMISAMEEATKDWMTYGHFTFSHLVDEDDDCTSDNPKVHFRVHMANSRHIPFEAKAFFPYAPKKQRTMYFKKVFVERDYDHLVGMVRHELGHVLGLRHEFNHPDDRSGCNEGEENYIPVTVLDPYSVMGYFTCGGLNHSLNLSDLDKEGIAQLYPQSF